MCVRVFLWVRMCMYSCVKAHSGQLASIIERGAYLFFLLFPDDQFLALPHRLAVEGLVIVDLELLVFHDA